MEIPLSSEFNIRFICEVNELLHSLHYAVLVINHNEKVSTNYKYIKGKYDRAKIINNSIVSHSQIQLSISAVPMLLFLNLYYEE